MSDRRPPGTGSGPADPVLRPVGPGDAALLAALQETAFASAVGAERWARAWSEAEMAALLALPTTFGRLAATGGVPDGFVLAQAAGGDAEILTLAVLPDRRRAGRGARLIAAAAAEGRRRGTKRLLLEVATCNTTALAFYRRLGFVRIGMRRNYYGEGPTADSAIVLARNYSG